MKALKKILYPITLICLLFACSTDDVDGDPTVIDPDPTEPVEIPDAAFGEYMVFNNIEGVFAETVNGEEKYFLNPDEVVTVSELLLSKTNTNIQILTDAGLATADQKITDLTGLEYFIGLQVLNLTSNDVNSIDLTNLTGLEDLGLNFNLIGSLDVTQNPNLTSLRAAASAQAGDNQKMSSIDLSNNTALRELRLSNHNFVSIDLSNNLQLDVSLRMEGNPGPDGNPDTPDIVVPAAIFNQLAPENRLGVVSDADVETTVFLSVNPSNLAENEDAIATITVSLNAATNQLVTVALNFAGSATIDVDYAVENPTIQIQPGQTQASTTLSVIDDNAIEGEENIIITLGNVTNAIAGENQQETITISDDDLNVPLVLNEILYDPSNSGLDGDANGDGQYAQNEDEFIELYNNSNTALDVSGFEVYDTEALEAGVPRHVIPEGTVIPPFSALVVFGGGNPTGDFGGSLVQTSTTGDMNLNNAGDILTVLDPDGVVIITFDIEPLSNNPNEGFTRSPDITGDFARHSDVSTVLFSPGTKLDGSSF